MLQSKHFEARGHVQSLGLGLGLLGLGLAMRQYIYMYIRYVHVPHAPRTYVALVLFWMQARSAISTETSSAESRSLHSTARTSGCCSLILGTIQRGYRSCEMYQGTKPSGETPEPPKTYCHNGAQVMKETTKFERNVLSSLKYLS